MRPGACDSGRDHPSVNCDPQGKTGREGRRLPCREARRLDGWSAPYLEQRLVVVRWPQCLIASTDARRKGRWRCGGVRGPHRAFRQMLGR